MFAWLCDACKKRRKPVVKTGMVSAPAPTTIQLLCNYSSEFEALSKQFGFTLDYFFKLVYRSITGQSVVFVSIDYTNRQAVLAIEVDYMFNLASPFYKYLTGITIKKDGITDITWQDTDNVNQFEKNLVGQTLVLA